MSVDIVSNFLTSIRNAIMVSKRTVVAPYSGMCRDIAKILKAEGFIKDYAVDSTIPHKLKLIVHLRYVDGQPAIHELTRVSRPGRRAYSKVKNIAPVIGGLGISIVSTNAGIITDKQARKLVTGGEIICNVW